MTDFTSEVELSFKQNWSWHFNGMQKASGDLWLVTPTMREVLIGINGLHKEKALSPDDSYI